MKLIVVLLLVHAICAANVDTGSVTVEFGILESISSSDTRTAEQVANALWKSFQNEDLEVGYDVTFLNITFTNDTSIYDEADQGIFHFINNRQVG